MGDGTKMSNNKVAMRKDVGKLRLDLLPVEWKVELARVMTEGAKKYEANNWLKGMPFSKCVSSMARHANKAMSGHVFDPEFKDAKVRHWAQVAWNALALMSYEMRGVGTNDLPPHVEYDDNFNLIENPTNKGE